MYNKIQVSNIRRRVDVRWTTADKIQEYASIVKILARQKRKDLNEANDLRRRQSKIIKELREDCQYYHSYKANCLNDDQRRRRTVLYDRFMIIRFQNQRPQKAIDYLQHTNNHRQRILDCVKYKKFLRMRTFRDLKLERAVLADRLEYQDRNKVRNSLLVLRISIERFVLRQNVAAEVNKLYRNVLKIMHDDSHYFEAILHVISEDYREQCNCMLRAFEFFNFARSELSEIQKQYALFEVRLKTHVKERERQMKFLKKTAQDVMKSCRHLCAGDQFRIGSMSGSMFNPYMRIRESFRELENNVTDNPDALLQQLAKVVVVPAFYDVYPRLVRQLRQEEVLYIQAQKLLDLRNQTLRLKNQLQTLLAIVAHDTTKISDHFASDRKELQRKIDEEKLRLKKEHEAISMYGEMTTSLKHVLNNMFETVNRFKMEVTSQVREGSVDSEDAEKDIEGTIFLPVIERNPVTLLNSIREKLLVLLAQETDPLDGDATREARVMRQRQALPTRDNVEEDRAVTAVPFVPEADIEEVAILSRSDVKEMSKSLVAKMLRLRLIAQMQGRKLPAKYHA